MSAMRDKVYMLFWRSECGIEEDFVGGSESLYDHLVSAGSFAEWQFAESDFEGEGPWIGEVWIYPDEGFSQETDCDLWPLSQILDGLRCAV